MSHAIRTAVADLTVIVSWRAKAYGEGHTFDETISLLETTEGNIRRNIKNKERHYVSLSEQEKKIFIKTEIGTKHSEIQKNIVINLPDNKTHKLFLD